jgi:hypothetical protein
MDDYLFPNNTIIEGTLVGKRMINYSTWQKEDISDDYLKKQIQILEYGSKSYFIRLKRWLRFHSILYNMIAEIRALRRITGRLLAVEESNNDKDIPLFYQIEKYEWLKEAWNKHLDNLNEIKKISNKIGAKLLIVLIPPVEQTYGFLRAAYVKKYDLDILNKKLKTFFDANGIDYLDLTPYFKEYANKITRNHPEKNLYLQYDNHLNRTGNKFTALLIVNHILKNNLINISEIERKRKIKEEFVNFEKEWHLVKREDGE